MLLSWSLFFLVYINDLPSAIASSQMLLFADYFKVIHRLLTNNNFLILYLIGGIFHFISVHWFLFHLTKKHPIYEDTVSTYCLLLYKDLGTMTRNLSDLITLIQSILLACSAQTCFQQQPYYCYKALLYLQIWQPYQIKDISNLERLHFSALSIQIYFELRMYPRTDYTRLVWCLSIFYHQWCNMRSTT